MLTASRAVLDLSSRLKEDYLYNIWRMGTRQIARGEKAEGGPFAYVIDLSAQHDPTRSVEFLRTFRLANIEVRQADAPFTAGGKQYPAGTYVLGPQAFRPYVVDLIDPKAFPERRLYPGGPPDPPYDMTGYELSFQMGVTIDRVKEPFALPAKIVDVDSAGAWRHHRHRGAACRLRPGAEHQHGREGDQSPAQGGREDLVGAGQLDDRAERRRATSSRSRASSLGVMFRALDALPSGLKPIRAPKIGLYRSYRANMDEGWTRWMLEQYEFPYTTLWNADIRTGDLSSYDVLLFADEADTTILNGAAAGTMPAQYVGGIGMEGATNVRRFVERGGWLVAWDRAADFAILALDLPLRNTVKDTRPQEFFIPGSLLRITTKNANPLAAGMEANAVAMFCRRAGVPARRSGRRGQDARGSRCRCLRGVRAPEPAGERMGAWAALATSPGASPARAFRSAKATPSSWASARTGEASRTTRSSCSSTRCSCRRSKAGWRRRRTRDSYEKRESDPASPTLGQ